MKLLTECVKLKKLMAANTNKLPINIECFMDDKDVSGHMDRAMFEELIAAHLADMEKVMSEVLAASGLKQEDIYRYPIRSYLLANNLKFSLSALRLSGVAPGSPPSRL